MKATGIVRRIDDLGRVVIPKEIRRVLRIREGDPLEIYTERDGEVIFKKYSPMGELSAFAGQICESLHKTAGVAAAICDRDAIIAAAGSGRRELMEKRITPELEQIMENRGVFTGGDERVCAAAEGPDSRIAVAAPILAAGDVMGCVLLLADERGAPAGDTELKLAQTVASFLGKQMEE